MTTPPQYSEEAVRIAMEQGPITDEYKAAPEQVNQDAYANWLFRMKPADPATLASLLDAAAYEKKIAE